MQSLNSDTLRSIDVQWALLAYTVPFELRCMLPDSDDAGVLGAVAVAKDTSFLALLEDVTVCSDSVSPTPWIREMIEPSSLSTLFIKLDQSVVAPREDGSRD